jgi:HK97 family phage major capsid protein
MAVFLCPQGFIFERKHTMSKLAQMRELRNVKAQEASKLNEAFPADKRMPAPEGEKLDAVLAEIEAIDKEITRENRATQLLAEANAETKLLNDVTKTPSAQKATKEEANAFRAFATGGMVALSDEQRSVVASRQTIDIRNAMSTTTTTEGGFTVALEYMKSLEEALKLFGGMRSVAKTIRTASGGQMQFPTADATGEVGAILAQNATTPRVDTTFGNVALDVYKYTSNDIALPFELLQDSFIDIEAYIQGLLAIRLGRIQNTHFTTGTGTAQPRGIVTGAASGRVGTSGQTLTVIYDDLVRLEHSVDPAYRSAPGVGYMMNDASLAVVRLIKDSQLRPIFVPGYETGVPGGAPDRLMGRPITINQDVAVMAANAKSILFGDFSKYVIRDVMDLTLFRMTDSAFTRNGQVGFLAMQRVGGNLIDVSGASVKYYQNSAT